MPLCISSIYVKIQGMDDDDLNVCYNIIMNNWCNSITGQLRSNVSILRDMIDIKDGVKECDSLSMDGIPFITDDDVEPFVTGNYFMNYSVLKCYSLYILVLNL